MTRVRLSFCIPTFNYGRYLGETLTSILGQAGDDVEIVIVDGASTDNTPEVVAGFQRRFPRLVYHRSAEKGGIDKDLAHAVALATGETCWLMSADDAIADGAIDVVRRALEQADIVLTNRVVCTRNLAPVHAQRWHVPSTPSRTFQLERDDELLDYLSRARSLGALFSFMSTVAFRRDAWRALGDDQAARAPHFAHAHRLWTAARQGASLRTVTAPVVLARGDNDSFAGGGQLRRFLIDVDGYDAIATHALTGRPDLQRAFRAVLRREHPWPLLAGPRSQVRDHAEWRSLAARLSTFGYAPAELAAVDAFGSRPWLVATARAGRRIVRRSIASAARARQCLDRASRGS